MTPIFYPVTIVPEHFRLLLYWNPLFYILTYFRDLILYNVIPTYAETLLCVTLSLGTLLIGLIVFRKVQNKFLLYI